MFNSAGDDSTILLDDDRIDRHSDCIKTGILIKRGQKYKSLKKRYFVLLQDGFLFYYKDKVDLDHPLGIIYLKSNAFLNKNAEISETVGFGFTIRAGSKRFLLAAESSEEKASWCRAIDKVITCCASREKALIQQQQRKRSQVVMSSSPTNVSAMNGTNVFDVSNNKSQQQQQQQPLSPTSSSSNTGGFVNEGSENGNQFQGNNTSLSTAPTTSGSYTSGNSTTLNGYEREKFEKLQRQKDEALNLLQQIDVTFVKLLSTTNLLKKEIQQGLEKIKPQSSEETQQNEHAQSSSEPHKKNQKAPQTSSSEDDSDTGFDTSDSEETDIRTSFDPTVILAPSTVSDLMNPVERLKGLKMTMDKVSNELSSLFEKLQFKNSSADETTKQLEETIEELEQENQELKQKVQDLETENAELTHHKRLLIKEVKKYRNEAVSTGSPPQQQQPSQQEEPRPQEQQQHEPQPQE